MHNPSKILIADDEPDVRRIIRRVLQGRGHQIIETDDGTAVAGLVMQERPDLVLLDIHMPRLDGIAVLSEIRDINPTLSVVMLTGDGDLDQIRLAMERGACEYLLKPFELKDLETSVTASLDRKCRDCQTGSAMGTAYAR